jgi:hypothetical protein
VIVLKSGSFGRRGEFPAFDEGSLSGEWVLH